MKNPNMWITVECTAGTHVADACRDLVDLANRLGVCVQTTFNGTRIRARPTDDPHQLAVAWDADGAASSRSAPHD